MSQPYVGEIRMFAGNFAPAGWAFCDGQLVAIAENEVLFQLIGTTYGGDGQDTFALPNLQSRVPIHMGTATSGTTYQIGEAAGVEQVTLTQNQIPNHNHALLASMDIPTGNAPAGNVTGQAAAKFYRAGSPASAANASAVSAVGGSQPHTNIQPYLCVNFIISLFGVFPSPT